MDCHQLLLTGMVLSAGSGISVTLLPFLSGGQRSAALMNVVGCMFGLASVYTFFSTGSADEIRWPSALTDVEFTVQMDALSALFLCPILVVSGLGSIYGLGYWRQSEHEENGRRLSFFYGLLTASMALLVVARDGVLFLVAWEMMAVSAYFAIGTEDHDEDTRIAAWVYLGASHFATLSLFGLFALMYSLTGTFGFAPLGGVSLASASAVLLVALFGFGVKAGIMPLHFWLPGAHAQAPSHVSAIMSGVVIKMGVYGIVRVCSLLPPGPTWWGGLLLALGTISGVLGVVYAVSQHDIKRLLAYSSIENVGIIMMGLGVALIGRSMGQTEWVVLGLSGALLHVWNHAAFKSLLFFSAGSVIHATHTREIDHMGGLQRTMPATTFFFLIGAVAICGLPPLNGFVSELFVYLGLFRTLGLDGGSSFVAAAFAAPGLAIIGALAVACFVKVYGTVFLGVGRSNHVEHTRESSVSMLVPMAVLAGCCVFIGLMPVAVAPLIQQGVVVWMQGTAVNVPELDSLVPLRWVSVAGGVLIVLTCAGWIVQRWRLNVGGISTGLTWDCGYAAPSVRMQYTSSSFAQMLVDLFRWVLWPVVHRPRIQSLFPHDESFHSHTPESVLDRAIWPFARLLHRVFYFFRFLQQGNIQAYLLYILIVLIVLLIWH